MIVELGHFALILALAAAPLTGSLPMIRSARRDPAWVREISKAAWRESGVCGIVIQVVAYEVRISDCSSDVCSSDLLDPDGIFVAREVLAKHDENYMPREVVDALKESGQWREGEGLQ